MHFSLKKKIRCSFENTYTLFHILLVQRISSKTDAIFRAKILLHWTPVLRNASYLKPKSPSQSVSQIPLWKMVFLVVCGEIMISGPSASRSLPLVKSSPAGSFRYADRFLSLSLLFLLQLLRDGLQLALVRFHVLFRCDKTPGGVKVKLGTL